jgi:hypothetical protein
MFAEPIRIGTGEGWGESVFRLADFQAQHGRRPLDEIQAELDAQSRATTGGRVGVRLMTQGVGPNRVVLVRCTWPAEPRGTDR